MWRLMRTFAAMTLCAEIAVASPITIDFDELPPVRFAVTLDDGTHITETTDGTFQIMAPDGSVTTVPKEFVPDGVLPAPGEVPIAAPLPSPVLSHVAFSTEDGAGLYYFSGATAVGSSEPNNITAAVDPNAFPYSADLYADFSNPVNGLTFTVSSDNDAGEIARVIVDYGVDDQASVFVVGNADPTDPIPMDLSGYSNVRSIRIVDVTDTYGLSYDDFSFVPANVPEPSGIVSALVALLAFASCELRRMRSSMCGQ